MEQSFITIVLPFETNLVAKVEGSIGKQLGNPVQPKFQRALDKNQRRGKIVAGGSTITQQLAKNLFLSGERSLLRKGQEAVLAAMLEAAMDKRRIFEIYLNVAEWGENVFGAEAAARYYFGVSAAGLEPEQAARLAAMLPRPRYYELNRGSAYLANYSESILAQMPAAQVP